MTHPQDDGALPPDPERVDPATLTALLRRHGWQRRGGAPGRYSHWTAPGAAPGTSLLVPDTGPYDAGPYGAHTGPYGTRGAGPYPTAPHRARAYGSRPAYADHADLLGEALTALARSPEPSARDILRALTVPGDEIHWRRDVPGLGAAVPWTTADQLRSAARAMLLAGARAALRPAAYHGRRHGAWADAFLDSVLVGPTGPAAGGDLLTAYTPVTPVPDGRRTATTLLRALQATRDAVDYQRATGDLAVFDAAVAYGVSHELARALIELVRGTEGVEVALLWSPAAGPPEGFPACPDPVEFSPGDLPALQAAGARYRDAEPAVAVRLTATVAQLRRPAQAGGGSVRLRVLAGADVRQVRVGLGEEDYLAAVRAHLAGLPIRISGRLESRGGFRRLTHPGGLTPVEVDDAERERLLKAPPGDAGPCACPAEGTG